MARHLVVSDRILQVMRGTPDCKLDDLVLSCREFPLQAVLSEVSHLSREDQLQLTLVSTGSFTVQLRIASSRSNLMRSPLNMAESYEKDSAHSQKRLNDRKSDTARKWGSAGALQSRSVYLTCNEDELESLMSEGEST